MCELNSYLKEKEQITKKIKSLNNKLKKEWKQFECFYIGQQIQVLESSLEIVKETIEKIKFEGEKY